MALDNVTSHFSTMLETIASASFLSSLSIIHGLKQAILMYNILLQRGTALVGRQGNKHLFIVRPLQISPQNLVLEL